MKWTILDADKTVLDPSGVDAFIDRMDKELRAGGPPLEGFKSLYSSQEMLQITREIENEITKVPDSQSTLYVGFQTVDKFLNETERYTYMSTLGIPVVGFGQGNVPDQNNVPAEQWVSLPTDLLAFENQWYLISASPNPIIFIGWETSSPELFGLGGISTEGKEFRGFVSNDERIIDAAINYLERVRKQNGPTASLPLMQLSEEIPFPISRIMMVTDDNQNEQIDSMRKEISSFAAENEAYVMLYDISAASYLVNPYPSGEVEKTSTKVLHTQDLGLMGRQYLVEQLDHLNNNELCAGVILATEHGFKHLAEWAESENADLIMIPQSLVNPGLIDRIKGYTLRKLLEATTIPIIVYKDSTSSWMRTRKVFKSNADMDHQLNVSDYPTPKAASPLA